MSQLSRIKALEALKLIHELKRRYWSDRQIADIVGCSRCAITRWRNGYAQPSPMSSHLIMLHVGRTVRELEEREATSAGLHDQLIHKR